MLSVVVLAGFSVYLFVQFVIRTPETLEASTVSADATLNQIRSGDHSLVRPLYLADLSIESRQLSGIKLELQSYISQLKEGQKVSDVSVYFRRMNDGAFFTINPNQVYNPASLVKVAFLITYLKEAESTPGLLERNLHFGSHATNYAQNIKEFHLTEGKDYSIRELLGYMIRYSDNDATVLLQNNANATIFNQLFTDLQIPVPDFSKEYYITSVDMAKLFRVLYNGTYLSKSNSELALKILSTSEFSKGILGGLDQPLTVAHKFGERVIGNTAQLHDFGIVYSGNQPYLLGVMTSGSNLDELSEVIKTISQKTFQQYRVYAGL